MEKKQLPPLPPNFMARSRIVLDSGVEYVYSAKQMREYALAALAAAVPEGMIE
jgi:hypothetical protein